MEFQTLKGGELGWLFGGEGDPLSLGGLGPRLSPVEGGVGSLLKLLLLE